MTERVQMAENRINICSQEGWSPEQERASFSYMNHSGFGESESEYDEEQFANVDEDIINVRLAPQPTQKLKEAAVKHQSKGARKESIQNEQSLRSYLRNSEQKVLTSYSNFTSNLTDK